MTAETVVRQPSYLSHLSTALEEVRLEDGTLTVRLPAHSFVTVDLPRED